MPHDLNRARIAARNNADLYAAIFDAHGLAYHRTQQMFLALDPPPPFYSDLTLQAPEATAEVPDLLARLGPGPRRSVKDSFCLLDPAAIGMEVLIEASWIWRASRPCAAPPGWHQVRDARALAGWEAAWKAGGSATEGRVFPETLLQRPDILIFGRGPGPAFDAGCIINLSPDAVGLSNVFSPQPQPGLFAEAADLAAWAAPDLPLVGYEWGAALDDAIAAGCDVAGDLRVLIAP